MPLHVFRAALRQMVQDALEADERFGIVLLRPGWDRILWRARRVRCGTVGTIEHAFRSRTPLHIASARRRFRMSRKCRASRIAPPAWSPSRLSPGAPRLRTTEWLADVRGNTPIPARPDGGPEIETVSLDALTNA